MAFARLNVREVFRANKPRQGLANRQQQGLRRTPSTRPPQLQGGPVAISAGAGRQLAERLVPFQQLVQRLQFTQSIRRQGPSQGPSFVIADEASKPITQSARA